LRLADRVIAIENGLVVDECPAGNVASIERRLSRYIAL
jgi:hypothetical protein